MKHSSKLTKYLVTKQVSKDTNIEKRSGILLNTWIKAGFQKQQMQWKA